MEQKLTKTYAVHGLMEWVAQIPAGKATLRVPFSGGTQTAYGVTPALFTTSNTLYMAVIENSSYFKQGRIKLHRMEGEEKQPDNAWVSDKSDGSEKSEKSDLSDSHEAVVVTCLDDARQYLIAQGADWTKLTSKSNVLKMAKEMGVTFKGL